MKEHITSYQSIHATIMIFNQLSKHTRNVKGWGFSDESERSQFFHNHCVRFITDVMLPPETLNNLAEEVGMDKTLELLTDAYKTLVVVNKDQKS
jgi:hypothetical protein